MDSPQSRDLGSLISDPPRALKWAVGLIYFGALGTLLGGIRTMFFMPREVLERQTEQQLRSQSSGPPITPELIEFSVNLGIAFVVVSSILGIGLGILLAITNRRGRQWARIVQTCFSVHGFGYVAFTLLNGSLLTYSTNVALDIVWSSLSLIWNVAVIVFLWRPETRAWFRAVSERRQTHQTATETSTA